MSAGAERIVAIYERLAGAWVSALLCAARFDEKGWLDRFCACLPSGGSELDIGCGAGVPIARHVMELGYSITGVDSSPAMISMFRSNIADQLAVVADMRMLSLARTYNGIVAWDSFFHLNHRDQRRMFPIFRAHAAPGAALTFTSGHEYGEMIGRLEGEPLYHASLGAEEYRQLLANEGFAVVSHVKEDPSCCGRALRLAELREATHPLLRTPERVALNEVRP